MFAEKANNKYSADAAEVQMMNDRNELCYFAISFLRAHINIIGLSTQQTKTNDKICNTTCYLKFERTHPIREIFD
jgi:hypothetical protein